jgi:hypothetical protein
VLGIANLITFHGDSVALFEAALHAAVAGYVDACRRLGEAPEKFAMAASRGHGVRSCFLPFPPLPRLATFRVGVVRARRVASSSGVG